jgi:hypothetical protein
LNNFSNVKKKGNLLVRLKSNNDIIGEANFDLKLLPNQNENQITFNINDKSGLNVSSIIANVCLICSYVKYYQDLITVTENNLKKYDDTIKKTTNILDKLNGKFAN